MGLGAGNMASILANQSHIACHHLKAEMASALAVELATLTCIKLEKAMGSINSSCTQYMVPTMTTCRLHQHQRRH